MIKPRSLNPHSRITIVSPASEIVSFPRRTQRGLEALEQLGYSVDFAPHAQSRMGRDAGTPVERASDIMDCFRNGACDAVIASTGGYTSLSILEHLDYETIAENPKILIGHSDVTALILGIYVQTGMTAFHGPIILPSFGDAAGVHRETARWFQRVLTHTEGRLDYPATLCEWSDHELFWDRDDNFPRTYQPDTGAVCLNPGTVEGWLLGGNLDTLLGLLATPYAPDFVDAILFLEEIGGSTSKTIRGLKVLEYAGVLRKISGLIVGRRYRYDDNTGTCTIAEVFREIGRKYGIPVLDNLPIGHTEPKLTLPLGIPARLDAERRQLSLLDSTVSSS